ncbi:hypothetical protein [Cohnella sp. AR92]|uniref:hypothetical protein n=1 Tax=Cohnella sp. AR92 TaxID=648716 RepID=UPI000F8F1706|nr:hypothetical protein [Cohnella sp. AR92]RUS45463.1 hypothetical protein ELR57_19070 [Cohnella sp. AR92]
MERTAGHFNADEKLRATLGKTEPFREIDIVDAVMDRVRAMNRGQRRTVPPRRLTKAAVLAATGSILLFGSVVGYAATEYAKLKDSKGKVVFETVPASGYTLPNKISERILEYRNRVHDKLKQDEMAAYYVKDDKVSAYAAMEQIDFESKLEYDVYGDYEEKMKKTKAPYLTVPSYLPEGYSFERGELTPRPPLRGEAGGEFEKIRGRLLTAAQNAKNNEVLFMEIVQWKKILNSKLVFSKQNAKLSLLATTGAENGEAKSTFSQRGADRSETVTLSNTQQAIYVRDNGQGGASSNSLGWYDETSNTFYSIYADNTVTREEMLKIGKSLVQAAEKR